MFSCRLNFKELPRCSVFIISDHNNAVIHNTKRKQQQTNQSKSLHHLTPWQIQSQTILSSSYHSKEYFQAGNKRNSDQKASWRFWIIFIKQYIITDYHSWVIISPSNPCELCSWNACTSQQWEFHTSRYWNYNNWKFRNDKKNGHKKCNKFHMQQSLWVSMETYSSFNQGLCTSTIKVFFCMHLYCQQYSHIN